MRGPPRRHPPPAGRVAERHAAGHHPALVFRHAQDAERLLAVEDAEHRGERAAHAVGPGRQLRAPDRREDGSAGRVAAAECEQEEWHVLEVVGEVLRRRLHSQQGRAVRVVRRAARLLQVLPVEGVPQLAERVPVQRAELRLHRRVVDQQEPPALRVPAAWRADRGVENAGLYLGRDRVRPHPPHRPGGVQRLVDVHVAPLVPRSRAGPVLRRIIAHPSRSARAGRRTHGARGPSWRGS